MELRQASSLRARRGRAAARRDGGRAALLRAGLLQTDTLVDVRGVVPRGISAHTIGAGSDAGRARGEPGDPGGPPRGVPARRQPADPQRRLARRQPPAGDPLLVLAARLPVPLARWQRVPRARGRASRACGARERLLRLGPSVGCGGGAARTRRDASSRPPGASGSASSTACRPRTTGGRRRSQPGELILEIELPPRDSSVYLKAMERKLFGFPLVGVAAVRDRRRRPGSRSRASRRCRGSSAKTSSPRPPRCPQNAYKLEIATALVRRARGNDCRVNRRVLPLATLLTAAVLSLAACGSGGAKPATTTQPRPATTPSRGPGTRRRRPASRS